MLTPQEVKSHAFQRASFGGYNMGQVDEFLDILTEDYTALYNDNAVLKSKMKVLVDKVEEYRSTEEAMRKALMTAQRMADELVQEAQAKAAGIKAQAEADIAQERKKAINEVKNEIGGLAMDIAGKVVEKEINEADHKKLIDDFIKNVGEAS
jgi:cell division initiation protein